MSARAIVSCFVFFTCAVVVMPGSAAELALVPISASGPHTIVGNEIILHGADQIVTLEIRASDWQPALIRSFQTYIDASGAASGDAGMLVPFGWDDPDLSSSSVCADDLDCPEGRVCWRQHEDQLQGFCAGPNHHPEDGFFIDETRSDYIFHGLGTIYFVDLSLWDPVYSYGVRCGATLLVSDGSVTYTPPPRYCSTLTLVAPPTAAGTFTMGFTGGGDTFLVDNLYECVFPDFIPALITVNPAECGNGICDSGEDAASCTEDCLPTPIPATSTWGLAVLGLLIATLAKVYYARKRVHVCQT